MTAEEDFARMPTSQLVEMIGSRDRRSRAWQKARRDAGLPATTYHDKIDRLVAQMASEELDQRIPPRAVDPACFDLSEYFNNSGDIP